MHNPELIGPWVRRFLLEHLVGERNLSVNTQRSYRDTLTMLLPLIVARIHKPLDKLQVLDISSDDVRSFLRHLEQKRGASTSTRNQRLAAVHALARFIAGYSPQHIAWSGEIRAIPFKKAARPLVGYLEKPEVEAILAAPRRSTEQGRRDYAVLLFLYNSGVRASELADLTIADLTPSTGSTAASVRIHGKGGKMRQCPIWPRTSSELVRLIDGRRSTERVFLNRRNEPITRYGIHALVERNVVRAAKHLPTLSSKRISPHTFRHTTATHLLRSGVDINTIRSWLGHVSLDTTQIYAEVDLEMKAKALAKCDTLPTASNRKWLDKGLMAFLRSL